MISDYPIKSLRKLIEVALPLDAVRTGYTDLQKLAGNRAVAAGRTTDLSDKLIHESTQHRGERVVTPPMSAKKNKTHNGS